MFPSACCKQCKSQILAKYYRKEAQDWVPLQPFKMFRNCWDLHSAIVAFWLTELAKLIFQFPLDFLCSSTPCADKSSEKEKHLSMK